MFLMMLVMMMVMTRDDKDDNHVDHHCSLKYQGFAPLAVLSISREHTRCKTAENTVQANLFNQVDPSPTIE